MDSMLIFRDADGRRCHLNPGTYTLHGPFSEGGWDPLCEEPDCRDEALIETRDGRWFLAWTHYDPEDLCSGVGRWEWLQGAVIVWGGVRPIYAAEAADWLLSH